MFRMIRQAESRLRGALLTLLTMLLLTGAGTASAAQATLAWDANTQPEVAGYMLHYGSVSGSYSAKIDVGKVTQYTVTGLLEGRTYYFAATAYDLGRTESGFSNEVSKTIPSAAPVASFTANTTSGPAPLSVSFTSTSTGSISSYAWSFGDGGTSASANPTRTYSTPGTYNVSLTVTGSGGSNTMTKTGYITVSSATAAPPVASFTATPTSGTAPLTVAFTSTSTGSISAYSWNFGDGGTSTSANPTRTYNTAGTYNVSLTVTGSGGSNTMTKTGYITVSTATAVPPVASFTATPTSGTAPLTVAFTSTSTGTISTYAWDFGDGTTSTAKNPSKVYNTAGSYTVKLTVNGSAGPNTATKSNFITVSPTSSSGSVTLSASPSSVASGGTLTASWSGIAKPTSTDWIGLYVPSAKSQNFVDWMYVSCSKTAGAARASGNCAFPVPNGLAAGTYELRLHDSNGWTVLARSGAITVTSGTTTTTPKLTVTPTSVAAGSSVTVSWSGIANPTPTDWIGLANQDWMYVSCSKTAGSAKASGSCVFPIPSGMAAGTYAFRLYSANTNTVLATSPVTVTAPTSTTTPGLVAAYGFEEGSGTSVSDRSGKGNNGTISGASWITTGRFGKALSFNGTSSWVTVADSASLDLTTGMTLEAWVYPTATMTGWRTVMMKEQPGKDIYYLSANTDKNQPATGVYVGGTIRQLNAGTSIPVNAWTHLAATYDGTTQRLYINGAQVASRAQAGTIATSTSPLRIGGNSVWGEYFKGLLDEVRIYNRALTTVEIQADMSKTVGP